MRRAPAGAGTPPEGAEVFLPIAYFNESCARCHGDYGSAYGETFGEGLSDEELRTVTAEMAEGPAFAPLEDAALDVLIAYHRSLIDGKPFVLVRETNAGLAGEVTPGSTVTLVTAAGDVEASVTGHTWSANAPDEVRQIVATKGDVTTCIKVGDGHSHRAALSR